MTMKLLLCLCVLLLTNDCFSLDTDGQYDFSSSPDIVFPMNKNDLPEERIIGGQEVTPHSYPFQVALNIYTSRGRYFCGGTLITKEWVLTAAHCLDVNVFYIIVFLGSHNINQANETHRIELNSTVFHFHARWNATAVHNDIGLVKLPTEVTLNEHIATVRFARKSNETYANRIGTMVGWGRTESTTSTSSVLRNVNSTVLTNAACESIYSYIPGLIIENHICVAGTGTVGTCSGDSGGPLLVDGVQVGVTSFGTANCTLQYPSVFTRVTEFEDWIIAYVGDGSDSYNKLHYSFIISVAFCLYQLFVYI